MRAALGPGDILGRDVDARGSDTHRPFGSQGDAILQELFEAGLDLVSVGAICVDGEFQRPGLLDGFSAQDLGASSKLQRRGTSRDEEHHGGEGREILGDHRRLISLQGPEDKKKRRAGVTASGKSLERLHVVLENARLKPQRVEYEDDWENLARSDRGDA